MPYDFRITCHMVLTQIYILYIHTIWGFYLRTVLAFFVTQGGGDIDLQGQIWLNSPNLPHFELFKVQ